MIVTIRLFGEMNKSMWVEWAMGNIWMGGGKWKMRSVFGNTGCLSCPRAKGLLIVEHIWRLFAFLTSIFSSVEIFSDIGFCGIFVGEFFQGLFNFNFWVYIIVTHSKKRKSFQVPLGLSRDILGDVSSASQEYPNPTKFMERCQQGPPQVPGKVGKRKKRNKSGNSKSRVENQLMAIIEFRVDWHILTYLLGPRPSSS